MPVARVQTRARSLFLALVAALSVWCITTSNAHAGATRTVCAAGTPTCDFSTIQSAIDASLDDDIIWVTPGVYAESVVVDRRVTVRGPGYGFDARTDPPTALNAIKITGDGSGPTLTIGGRGRVMGVVVSGAIGDGASGVEFVEAVGAPPNVPSGVLEDSIIMGNTSGVRAGTRSRGQLTESRVTGNVEAGVGTGVGAWVDGAASFSISYTDFDANPVAGVAVAPSVASGSLSTLLVDIDDAQVAFDAVDIDRISVVDSVLNIPTGGTGIRAGAGVDDVDISKSKLLGAGAGASGIGVDIDGAGHVSERVNSSRFEGLQIPVRVAGAAPPSGTQIGGNLFVSSSTTPPVELVTARDAHAFGNFVACPAVSCPTFTGVGAAMGRSSDLTPAMWFVDRFADDSRLTSFTVSGFLPTVHVWVGLVDPSGVGTGVGEFGSPTFGLKATLAGAQGLVGRDQFDVGRSQGLEITEAPGTRLQLSGTLLGRPFTSPLLHLRGVLKGLQRPTIVGKPYVGQRLTCRAAPYPVAPTEVGFQWEEGWYRSGDGTELAGPTTRVVTRADLKRGRIYCTARAKFVDYEDKVSTSAVRVLRTPLVIKVTSLNSKWRPMRCGARPSSACRASRRVGVRFHIATQSRVRTKARLQFERQVRGRWVPWVRGTLPIPDKRAAFLPSTLVQPGSYRMRFTVAPHDVFAVATSTWQYWAVR